MGNNIEKAKLLGAAESGDVYSVKTLVEQRVSKSTQDKDGKTPLMLAAEIGYLDVVRYLVDQGADKEQKDEHGETALIRAAAFQHLDVVRYLIKQGANKTQKNAYEETALIRATEEGHVDVVRYLVQQGDKIDEDGKTALHWAAGFGRIEVVRYLVEQGVDKDNIDENGKPPLVRAAMSGYLDVVRYFVEQGADKDKTDEVGISPLVWVAVYAHLGVLRYLVEQGADMNGQNAVMWAARNGKLYVVQRLVQNNADPTGLDKDGNSVLLLLLTRPDISEDEVLPIAKLLLDHGTSPLVINNEGKSAISVANSKGFHRVAAMVEEHRIVALVKKYAAKPQPAPASRYEPETEETLSLYISPGDVVRVGAALATGSFGIVYHAKWAHIDVVVKEFLVVELRRFLKEVNTWRNLRHANVVLFYGANHRNEPYFIVSEYANNGELVPYPKRKKQQGRNFVWRKLKEVAIGLGYLHTQGVVHGDLKGNNIMVNDNGTAMLTDFGLSFQESGSCSVKKMKDTLDAMAWRAPEFAHMTTMTPTRKSDVYSLGMSIIEAVTFTNPWCGYNNEKIRQFLRNGEIMVNRPGEMTDAQWELVERMISVSPDDRPELADVVKELALFAEDEEMEEAGL